MPVLNEILGKVADLMDYVTRCIDLPMYAASCRPLWSVIMYVSVLLGSAVIAWVFWLAVTRQNSITAKPARSTGANPRKRQALDEGVDIADVTDPHLAIKIRQELERQRIRNITGR